MSVEAVVGEGLLARNDQQRVYALIQKHAPDMVERVENDVYKQLVNSFVKNGELQGRKLEYLERNKELTAKTMFVAMGGGSLAGAVVGGVCGAACGSPGGPIGMGAGAGIGAAGGAFVGFVVGSCVVYHDYRVWLESDEGRAYGGTLKEFCLNDPVINNLCCGITYDIIQDPVKTKNGHVYEREAIYEHIDQERATDSNTGRPYLPMDPQTGEPISKKDLMDAPEIRVQMGNRLEEIIEEKGPRMSPQVLNGFKNLQKSIETERERDYQRAAIQLKKRRDKEELSAIEYRKARKELAAIYF